MKDRSFCSVSKFRKPLRNRMLLLMLVLCPYLCLSDSVASNHEQDNVRSYGPYACLIENGQTTLGRLQLKDLERQRQFDRLNDRFRRMERALRISQSRLTILSEGKRRIRLEARVERLESRISQLIAEIDPLKTEEEVIFSKFSSRQVSRLKARRDRLVGRIGAIESRLSKLEERKSGSINEAMIWRTQRKLNELYYQYETLSALLSDCSPSTGPEPTSTPTPIIVNEPTVTPKATSSSTPEPTTNPTNTPKITPTLKPTFTAKPTITTTPLPTLRPPATPTISVNSIDFLHRFGGSGFDRVQGIAYNDIDGTYITVGNTGSADFPVTSGAFDTTKNDSFTADGFITKIDKDGKTILWSSYFGGNDRDQVYGVIVTRSGDYVLCGTTTSRDFPTTSDAPSNRFLWGMHFLRRWLVDRRFAPKSPHGLGRWLESNFFQV